MSVVAIAGPLGSLTAASQAVSFAGTPAVGDDIIVVMNWYDGATSDGGAATVSDDATGGSNSYTTDVRRWYADGSSEYVQISRCKIARTKAGLTITVTAPGQYVNVIALQVNGLKDNPVDVAVNGTHTTSPRQLSTGTLGAGKKLIVGVVGINAPGEIAGALASSWSGATETDLYICDGNPRVLKDSGGTTVDATSGEEGAAAYVDDHTGTSAITLGWTDNGSLGSLVAPIAAVSYLYKDGTPFYARPYSPDANGMRTVLRM